jgi:PAS domain S-box-containing protein
MRDVAEVKDLENRLRFFTLLVENSLDLTLVADPEGVALYVNPRVEQVLGYGRDEFLSIRVPDLLHPDDYEPVMAQFASAASDPGTVSGYAQGRYRHKDGSWVWIEGIAISLLDDPVVGGIICCGRDINECKQAERLLRSLTPREMEILCLLAVGRTNREIAQQLNFSVSTVKNHVQQILVTLDASDRTQAAVRAAELGFIEQRD